MIPGRASSSLFSFNVSVVEVPADSSDDNDRVVSQDPLAGESLAEDGTVTLEVGVYEEPAKVTAGGVAAEMAYHFDDAENRARVIDALEESVLDSVDKLAVEEGGLVIAGTSGYQTEEYVAEDAWALARLMSHFWSDDYWVDSEVEDGAWQPFRLEVNDLSWSCPGEVMRGLAETVVSRSEWENACRQD